MSEKNLIEKYVEEHKEETLEMIKTLAAIPAPSGKEEKRAEYILQWLKDHGAEDAFVDAAGNVIYLYPAKAQGRLTVVTAHTDVVAPDETPLPITDQGDLLVGPGVRDDTANLVNMLMGIRYLLEQKIPADNPVLFAAVTGEEGLGNLKGSRQIWDTYGSQIDRWVSFDLNYDTMYHKAVGSHRYQITLRTEGGHSYKDFGNQNAIAQLAELITELYQIPAATNPKVTYNVGVINGGTSVNTIAQEAYMLYEFRSDSQDELKKMEKTFMDILQKHQQAGKNICCETVGIRPGNGEIDQKRQTALEELGLKVIRKYYDGKVKMQPGSTDCNIPLSHGVPSICIGTVMGEKTHTRQETVQKESLVTGQKIAIEMIEQLYWNAREQIREQL
ncbi:MAG: M20/M25/M40 family metallo-hydrolase [Muricoprocola sp.]